MTHLSTASWSLAVRTHVERMQSVNLKEDPPFANAPEVTTEILTPTVYLTLAQRIPVVNYVYLIPRKLKKPSIFGVFSRC